MHSRPLRIALSLIALGMLLGAVPGPAWQPAPVADAASSWRDAWEADWLAALAPAPPVSAPAQVAPLGVSVCRPPQAERQLPERTSELRLVRDSFGDYWQIQSGCRHRVVPQSMEPAALRTIPLGSDVGFVTFSLPAVVPTPAPLGLPSYAQVPLWLQGQAAPTPVPAPTPTVVPGFLRGYADGVLVFDPADTNTVYLLSGGMRHRVMVHYPYCVVYPAGLPGLCQPTEEGIEPVLGRGGDPAADAPFPYFLRRRADTDCSDIFPSVRVPRPVSCTAVYEQLFYDLYRRLGRDDDESRRRARTLAAETADFVANIEEIPLGEPAPNYGWGRGESSVLTARVTWPDAQPCRPGAVRGPGAAAANPCSARFDNAQPVPLGQYLKDPSLYEGTDIRMRGVACNVRYNRQLNVVQFSLVEGDSSVAASAPGRRAQQDPDLVDNARLEVGASVTPAGETLAVAGQLVVFEYTRVGSGLCERFRGGGGT